MKSIRYFTLTLICLATTSLFANELSTPPAATLQQNVAPSADSNKLLGQAFLAKNMAVTGVVTLPDGLQYKIIRQGQGDRPGVPGWKTPQWSAGRRRASQRHAALLRGAKTKT